VTGVQFAAVDQAVLVVPFQVALAARTTSELPTRQRPTPIAFNLEMCGMKIKKYPKTTA
jgi:hypothetical protein